MPLSPEKIQSVMQARKMTQAQLSRLTGIAPPNLVRILSGDRTDPVLSTAERIAAALRTPLHKLTQTES
jgi:transcriptional regulator with XRE-family HTH domain